MENVGEGGQERAWRGLREKKQSAFLLKGVRTIGFKQLRKWALGLLLPTAVLLVVALGAESGPYWAVATLALVIYFGTLFFFVFISPSNYEVRKDSILINRLWRPILLPFREIESFGILRQDELKPVKSRGGVRGPLGNVGRFYSKPAKKTVRLYTYGDDKEYIQVTMLDGKTFVLSPDSPQRMNEVMEARIPERDIPEVVNQESHGKREGGKNA